MKRTPNIFLPFLDGCLEMTEMTGGLITGIDRIASDEAMKPMFSAGFCVTAKNHHQIFSGLKAIWHQMESDGIHGQVSLGARDLKILEA